MGYRLAAGREDRQGRGREVELRTDRQIRPDHRHTSSQSTPRRNAVYAAANRPSFEPQSFWRTVNGAIRGEHSLLEEIKERPLCDTKQSWVGRFGCGCARIVTKPLNVGMTE